MNQSEIHELIGSLKKEGQNALETVHHVRKEAGISYDQARDLVFNSPTWVKFLGGPNPFNDEFISTIRELNNQETKIKSDETE